MAEKLFYSYNDIHNICVEKAQMISNDFVPDVILAIGGGGLIPARILRSKIDIPIYVVTLSTYDENNNPINEPRIIQWADFSELKNKRILIVDEVDDTRKTLKYLIDKLINEEKLHSENLGIFVLHNKKKDKQITLNNLNISYYISGKIVEDKWIVYPWE